MKIMRNIFTTKFFVIVMVLVFFFNFFIPTILEKDDETDNIHNADAGTDTEEIVYEIDKHADWGDTMLNITMWDEDITSTSAISQVASLAKDYGYTGVDYAINWYNIQNALTGENMYDFSRIDSRLEAIYKEGMLSCVSVFFTTSYYEKHLSQEMMDALKWQETADGQVFFKENYGAAPCISDPYTHSVLINAFEAFCTHIFEKYGTSVTRVEARISQYGELEYSVRAIRDDINYSDYSAPSKINAIPDISIYGIDNITEGNRITWNNIIAADKFEIHRAEIVGGVTGDFEYELIATVDGDKANTEKITYVDKTTEFGKKYSYIVKLIIDNEVIAQYAGSVAVECFGIVGMAGVNVKDGLVRLLKMDSITRGINVSINNNKLTLNFHVIVAYGVSIVAVSENLMSNVKYKVEEFTGMEIEKINIFVEGVRVID